MLQKREDLLISDSPVPGGPNNKIPLTCLHPSCSMISGGKTRDANARRKIALNSLSKPPIPILPKSQSGLMIDWRTIFLQISNFWNYFTEFHTKIIKFHPFAFPTRLIDEFSAFSNWTTAFPVSFPKQIFFTSAFLLSLMELASMASIPLMFKPRSFLSWKLNTSGWPTVTARPANCMMNSFAIKSES